MKFHPLIMLALILGCLVQVPILGWQYFADRDRMVHRPDRAIRVHWDRAEPGAPIFMDNSATAMILCKQQSDTGTCEIIPSCSASK